MGLYRRGWTWVSDEPWGWATYHYGRWVNIVGTGWVWIPGHTWAPAWVSWRYGGGYCGWAPLPPSTLVGVDFGGSGINLGFDFYIGGDCDTAFGIGPGCYNFIPVGYIGNPYYRGHYIDRSRNFVIINNTRNITHTYVSRNARGAFGGVRVDGPAFATVNRYSHTPVQQVRLAAAGQAGRSTISGGTLNVFAPRINPATLHQARPGTVARTLSNVNINRGTSIRDPLAVNDRYKPAAPSEEAIRAAQTAEAKAPASVATMSRVAPTVSATTIQKERTQALMNEQTAAQQKASAGQQARQQTLGNEQAQRQERATADQQARQQTATQEQVQRQQQAPNEQAQRQQQALAAEKEHAAAVQQERAQRKNAPQLRNIPRQRRPSSIRPSCRNSTRRFRSSTRRFIRTFGARRPTARCPAGRQWQGSEQPIGCGLPG